MDSANVRAWLDRWREVEERSLAELRALTAEEKLAQLEPEVRFALADVMVIARILRPQARQHALFEHGCGAFRAHEDNGIPPAPPRRRITGGRATPSLDRVRRELPNHCLQQRLFRQRPLLRILVITYSIT
jgi:hypothetical protein